ncbi:MAG: hypothetical protein JWO71_3664 [Candidatus Acidoferrum typicum]|nr:hypothetical protein [Candidatus Acidoferrum typicum]
MGAKSDLSRIPTKVVPIKLARTALSNPSPTPYLLNVFVR